MQRAERKFRNKTIRLLKDNDGNLLISPHDAAKALNFEYPSRAVINLTVYHDEDYQRELTLWEDYKEVYLVGMEFIIDLSLRAEQDISKDFILWIMSVSNSMLEKQEKDYEDNHQSYAEDNTHFATTQIANKYGMTATQLNAILYKKGIQRKVNHQWVLTSKFQNKGLTKTIELRKANGNAVLHTYWTKKGMEFLDDLLMNMPKVNTENEQARNSYNNEYKQLNIFDEYV